MRIKLRKKKPSTERRPSKTVDEYICINGKKLSEQTIYDYAPFIPKWDDRIPLDDDGESFLVSCVLPENHLNGDDPARSTMVKKDGVWEEKQGSPSLMISKGHTQNVVINCRKNHNGGCSNEKIRQYFLSRLIGDVHDPSSLRYVPNKKYTDEEIKEKFWAKWYSRKSPDKPRGRRRAR